MLTKLRMKCLIFPSIFSSSVPKTTPFSTVSNSNPTTSKIRFPISIKPNMVSSSNSLSMLSIHTRCLRSKAFSSSSSYAHSGEIHVIVGPMFAGKTTTLLRRIQTETDHGRNVAIIKSNKDTRYGLDSIVSHDGVTLPCWALPNLSFFRQKFGADAYNQLDVIGIDEAQFFEDLYEFCQEAADHDGKTLIVSGLDGDYLRRSFGSVLHIIPLADSVTKLSARCELCGKRAFFTLRKTDDTQTELIGGTDIYMPVCRQHYVSGQVAVETARTVLASQMVQCRSPG